MNENGGVSRRAEGKVRTGILALAYLYVLAIAGAFMVGVAAATATSAFELGWELIR